MRLLRLDDYPVCRVDYPDRQWVQDNLVRLCDVLNLSGVRFILGAIPLAMTDEDIHFLNGVLCGGNGYAVMHGFTHAIDRCEEVESHLDEGGEFYGRSVEFLRAQYNRSLDTMINIKRFDNAHFIAPFNRYNQQLTDTLLCTDTKYLHTADVEYDKCGYKDLLYYNIKPVIAKYQKTYGHIQQVLDNDDGVSPICLHWMIDAQQDKNWLDKYKLLCDRVIDKS